MKKSERDKYISFDELKKFLEAAESWSAFWHLLFYAHATFGTRIQELLLLRWYDIDFGSKKVTIPTLKRKKDEEGDRMIVRQASNGKIYMVVPISLIFDNEDLFNRLRNYKIASEARDINLIFPISSRMAQYAFKTILKKAGLPGRYSTHSFRHLQGIATYAATKDLFKTAHRLRHRGTKNAAKYVHITEEMDSEIASDVGRIMFGGKS